MRTLLISAAVLASTVAYAHAEVRYVPGIKWYVAGPIEALFNKLGGAAKAWERDWELLPPQRSLAACEQAVDDIVQDWGAVVAWKCVVVNL